jgi:hypothetical protein
MTRTVTICPACGSDRVVPIEHGLPGADMAIEEQAGRIVLGGCEISDSNPQWACRSCDRRW